MQSDEMYQLFGRRVAAMRDSVSMTQTKLAKAVGLSRASIANIEAGRQRIFLHQFLDLAKALKLRSPSELLPTNLILNEDVSNASSFQTTGSKVNSDQRADVARVFYAFDEIET